MLRHLRCFSELWRRGRGLESEKLFLPKRSLPPQLLKSSVSNVIVYTIVYLGAAEQAWR